MPSLRELMKLPAGAEPPPAVDESSKPVAAAEHPSVRRFVELLTSETTVGERMDSEALWPFCQSVIRTIQRHVQDAKEPSACNILVGLALLPRGKRLIEFQFHPAEAAWVNAESLHERLTSLPMPAVVDGPVVVAICEPVAGGHDAPGQFSFPFTQSLKDWHGSYEERLMWAAGLNVPQRKTAWQARLRGTNQAIPGELLEDALRLSRHPA